MTTNSPILDIMIEIVTNESSGLFAIQAAGEVIAADAAFNIRMADAHGGSGHGTAAGMMGHMRAYEAQVETAQKAWSAFKDELASGHVLRLEPHEGLEAALRGVRGKLNEMS